MNLKSLCFAGALIFVSLSAASTPILVPNPTETTTYIPKSITTHDGLTLGGHLAIPAKLSPPFSVVLMLVGSGPVNRYEAIPARVTVDGKPTQLFKGIEDALIAKGIAVFAYDKRGTAPKDNSFLDNNFDPKIAQTATEENLIADAIAAFDLVKKMPQINPDQIAVLGHSEGTALAIHLAEARPNIVGLFMLGLFTRSMRDILYYQNVINGDRIFYLIDDNHDGFITQNEYTPFLKEPSWPLPDWSTLLAALDITHSEKISEQEWNYAFEVKHKEFIDKIYGSGEWEHYEPRDWFKQYFADGSYLSRHAQHCGRIHLFQGEVDIQTPYEDALELRWTCLSKGTPLASFNSIPNVGHGFSRRTGLRNWRDTGGPMEPAVALKIANEAAILFGHSEL